MIATRLVGAVLVVVAVGCNAEQERVEVTRAALTTMPSMSSPRVALAATSDSLGRIYVVGGDYSTTEGTFERFNPSTEAWESLEAPPGLRYGAAAVNKGNKIFVLGGELDWMHSEDYTRAVWAYDISNDSWSTVGQMKGGRAGLAAAVLGNRIYSTGGNGVVHSSPAPAVIPAPGEEYFLDDFGIRYAESFSLTSNASRFEPALAYRREDHALLASADKLYSIGGEFMGSFRPVPGLTTSVGVTYINGTVESYDPDTDEWETLEDTMPTIRSQFASVVGKDGLFYTFGGRSPEEEVSGAVDVFDPATETWTTVSDLPTPRVGAAAAVGSDGLIYVMGGRDEHGRARALVEVYDPANDSWISSDDPGDPADALDDEVLGEMFESDETQLPDQALLEGWWAGRCYEEGSSVSYGGLLVAYKSGTKFKVSIFITSSQDDREMFDVLSEDEIEMIDELVDDYDSKVAKVRVIDKTLTSLVTYEGWDGDPRVYEYQVTRLNDQWLSRTINVTDDNSLRAICVHNRDVR